MKSVSILFISLLFLSVKSFSQVSPDSITSLKQQKQSLELSTKINERKLQLAKLENNVDKKTREMNDAVQDAQKAADENADAASKLSSDPADKTLARRARQAAKAAERSAKRSRSATDDLADLRKDIESLKSKIAEDESKLSAMPGSMSTNQ